MDGFIETLTLLCTWISADPTPTGSTPLLHLGLTLKVGVPLISLQALHYLHPESDLNLLL